MEITDEQMREHDEWMERLRHALRTGGTEALRRELAPVIERRRRDAEERARAAAPATAADRGTESPR